MSDLNRRIELEALITEREGMIAMNMQREHLGQSMAYEGNAFVFLADKLRALKEPEAPAYTPEDVARLVEAALKAEGIIECSRPLVCDENGGDMCANCQAWSGLRSALAPFKEKK